MPLVTSKSRTNTVTLNHALIQKEISGLGVDICVGPFAACLSLYYNRKL